MYHNSVYSNSSGLSVLVIYCSFDWLCVTFLFLLFVVSWWACSVQFSHKGGNGMLRGDWMVGDDVVVVGLVSEISWELFPLSTVKINWNRTVYLEWPPVLHSNKLKRDNEDYYWNKYIKHRSKHKETHWSNPGKSSWSSSYILIPCFISEINGRKTLILFGLIHCQIIDDTV